ncbi:MAG: hypothetical protein QXJ68_06625 [Methanocellales archaeon]
MGICLIAKYTISNKEKHEIEIDFIRWMRKLRIKIDGTEAEKWDSLLNGDMVSLEFGREEKHRVDIKIGGVFVPTLTIYVDGKLLEQEV